MGRTTDCSHRSSRVFSLAERRSKLEVSNDRLRGNRGKDTLWRGAVPLRPSDLERIQKRFWKEETAGFDPDKRTRIVWFVEAANTGINWMEPRDVPLEQALVGVNVAGGIQSDYSDGLPAQLMPYGCDGFRSAPARGFSPDAHAFRPED